MEKDPCNLIEGPRTTPMGVASGPCRNRSRSYNVHGAPWIKSRWPYRYPVEAKEALQVSPGLWKKYNMRERESSDLGLLKFGSLCFGRSGL